MFAHSIECLFVELYRHIILYYNVPESLHFPNKHTQKHIKATHFSLDYENTMLACILVLLLLYAAKEMSPYGWYEVPLSSCFESALKPIHQTEAPEMWPLFK